MLHYLPFQALLRGDIAGEFLAERYEITYVPSASVWLQLIGASELDRADPHGTGRTRVLALAPEPGLLPGSLEEASAIAGRFPAGATVLVGPEATESRFRDAASSYDALHVASRGVLNKENPLFSYIKLGEGSDSDGRLEVHEVFGLDLQALTVVLSACETALGSGAFSDVPPGDDWVGLVRAFLFAGASNVVASLWRVDDRATALLMEHFYTGLSAGLAPGEALAAAQRATLRDAETADPFYWASFTLNGRGY
jgi:CHAT domain-containing protein